MKIETPTVKIDTGAPDPGLGRNWMSWLTEEGPPVFSAWVGLLADSRADDLVAHLVRNEGLSVGSLAKSLVTNGSYCALVGLALRAIKTDTKPTSQTIHNAITSFLTKQQISMLFVVVVDGIHASVWNVGSIPTPKAEPEKEPVQ